MPQLYVIGGSNIGQSFSLGEVPFYIGRGPENELVCQDGNISRKHASIEKSESGFVLKDLNSNNGTLLNNNKITKAILRDGDEIKVGTTTFLFVTSLSAAEITNRIQQILEKENKNTATRRLSPKDFKKADLNPLFINQTQLFIELANTFIKPSDIETLCNEAINHLLCAFPIYRCFLYLWDDISRELEPSIIRPASLKESINSIIERDRLEQLVQLQKVSLKNFPANETTKAYSSLLLPMSFQEELLGAIQIDCFEQEAKINVEDLSFFKGLINQFTLGINNVIKNQHLVTAQQHTQKLSKFVSPEVLKNILKSDEMDIQVENTLCTILFSDISGFTAMSERLPPRRVAKLLNEYFSLMVTILFAHNGSLDKFIGDAIMAIFGAPISREDDADRAVSTAIEMQQAIHKMNQKRIPEEQFNVRIGINSGYCVAGRIGSYQRMEYTVLGDTVNLASRIEANGSPGKIIIGEATRALLGPSFDVTELEPIRVKNKANPIRIFEVNFSLIA